MGDRIKGWYLKLVPPDTPQIIRKAAKWTRIFFLFVTSLLTLKAMFQTSSLLATFWVMTGFLLFSFFAEASVFGAFRILMLMTAKTNLIKLDEMYNAQGYTPEMGQLVNNSNPFHAPNELLISGFLYLMAEDYEKAKTLFLSASTAELSQRRQALLLLCRLQHAVMNGKIESAERLFAEQAEFLDNAYASEPELLGKVYKPYLDDALVYYTLAGALSERRGDHAAALRYRSETEYRAGKCSTTAETALLTELFDLNLLYAKGDLEAGDAKMRALRGEISCASVIPPGRQDDLLRMTAQGPIYANVKSASGKDISKERPLPVKTEASPIADQLGLTEF